MYIYFDNAGEIKSISPILKLDTEFETICVPVSNVEDFLSGASNPTEYFIKTIVKNDNTLYTISKKIVKSFHNYRDINQLPTLIEYLDNAAIYITNILEEKILKIELSGSITQLLESETEDIEHITAFSNTPVAYIYFTKKYDPHFLLYSISFDPTVLIENKILYINHNIDTTNTSVFSMQTLGKYSYTER